MASRCVGSVWHEEVWEATNGRAVVGFGPSIFLPVIIQVSIASPTMSMKGVNLFVSKPVATTMTSAVMTPSEVLTPSGTISRILAVVRSRLSLWRNSRYPSLKIRR